MGTIAAAIAALVAGIAVASDDDAPIRYHRHGMTVIMRSSMTPINVVLGDNPLDKPHTFTCKSASGCVVLISSSNVQMGTDGTETCSFVDGTPAAPGCVGDFVAPPVVRQQQTKVSQGQHTLQTIVHSLNAGGQITGWQVAYTIYERKVHGTN
ncbi:MAG TPA: hypothetical protein VHU18_00630 [Rhizomicrobium sp.]|jgi:hypothetical protein|nr:hypothetical protein [Rhizomicrobium sp.]